MGYTAADEDKIFQQEVAAVKEWWKVSTEAGAWSESAPVADPF
jgi:hypothetical protein